MLVTLFQAFLQIGLFSVGGGYAAIPLIQDQIVTKLGLLTMAEFTDLITIAEMTPGPISINSATFVGQRVYGFWGAFVCTIAIILPSLIICLTLAYIYFKYQDFKGIKTVLGAMRPAVVALIANAGLSILLLAIIPTNPSNGINGLQVGLFITSFFLLRRYKVNPIAIILGSGFVGVIIQTLIF
ncbi:MAG TPA: chromate transporter [Erysipelothrix sp.]|nr:chromate transporter [Erysipelothrix sp.]